MTEANLTHSSPFSARFLAWMHERFPFANAILMFIIYLTTAALARFTTGTGTGTGPIHLGLDDIASCLVTWSFFLLLRVFDEHKDYALDVKNHPQRVLQRGLITLNHLKIAGGLAIVMQLAWSSYRDGGAAHSLLAWGIMFGWTCLMGKEFFCGEWLERHLTLYAFSHMLVMPLIIWWLANLAVPGTSLNSLIEGMMTLAFLSGFCFEITRKTRGPEEERETVDSYSKIFGTRGSAFVVMGLLTGMFLNQLCLLRLVRPDGPVWAILLMSAAFLFGIRQLFRFVKSPSLAGREANEKAVALTMVAGYAVLNAAIVAERGISLSGV